ncbi:nucleoside triphosphate pyrophosphohydrolase [Teredinibacter purpureus]|uniref:nucleoside triphosphate pyrophosphohydrolase n=1 Tax=Teredinibacter purpureus TaxID=2731756 RepID=UPI0005F796F8|nr:nucleoside triphosphate pyrophosphohydrolase [Teredinibacter purpureus]
MNTPSPPRFSMEDLLYLMERLRDPETGCPWDIKQNYRSITPSTIEEAYEVVDAIEQNDLDHLKEELGDLLFQVVFYGQLAQEESRWSFNDVVHTLTAKLIRRHPHVFPEGTLESQRAASETVSEASIKASWEAIKQRERSVKGKQKALDDVPRALPALKRAEKLQKRAAKVGFDWSNIAGVFEKLQEEVAELHVAIQDESAVHIAEELGDLLFSCVNLARHNKLDAEQLVRQANQKFERRFNFIEAALEQAGSSLEEASVEQMDLFWDQSKANTID